MSGSNPDQLWNLIPNGPTPLTGQEQFLAAQTASPNAPMYRYPTNALSPSGGGIFSSVIATGSTIARTLANRFADRYSVLDWLTPGQPDGTTDNAPQLQAAISGAAGVAQLLFPATANPYIIGSGNGLQIPSDSHLIIEQGATLQIMPGTGCNGLQMQPGASNILIELYGALDGNVINGTTGGGGIVGGGTPGFGGLVSSNIYVIGNNQGVIKNFHFWGISLTACVNSEINGVLISDCTNSTEFAGLSLKWHIAAGTYTPVAGVFTLTTATTHGIVPGQTFTLTGTSSGFPLANIQGEYVALAGTTGTTVVFTSPPGLGATTFPDSTSMSVATCNKCANVGFVNCVNEGIQDLGIGFYGGVYGGYVRGCEVRYSSGPFIFSDPAQPGTNWDCEISDCYCHDNVGTGPFITSNAFGVPCHRSLMYNNRVSNNYGGGMDVNAADGAEVFGNALHNNNSAIPFIPNTATRYGTQIVLGSHTNVSIWGNTIQDPGPTASSVVNSKVASGSYDTSTGNVIITTAAAHGIPIGGTFFVQVVRGTGNTNALRGLQTATAGTSGTTLTFTVAPGLGPITFFDGGLAYRVPTFANNGIVSGAYTSATGAVSLTTFSAHGIVAGNMFVLAGMTGTGAGALNGTQIATTGTTGTTLNFTAEGGMTATITGGNLAPPNFGIYVTAVSFIANTPAINTRITNNFFSDNQSPKQLVAPLAGTWGVDGYSSGNSYGNRESFIADLSTYTPGLGGSFQGPSFDNVFEAQSGNYNVAGIVTFGGLGQSAPPPLQLQPRGMAVGWNASDGAGEANFYCGKGAGQPGGFSFLQVSPLNINSGTYTAGAVVLTTNVPHGLLPGSPFTVSNASNSSFDSRFLNGSETATSGTTGTTVNYTAATGLTIYGPGIITGGNVIPTGSSMSYGVTSGTYNSGTGAVSLTTATASGLVSGNSFTVLNLTDGEPDVAFLNGAQTATAGTTLSTIDYTIGAGHTITHTTIGGTIVPEGLPGGVVDINVGSAGILIANDGDGNTLLGGALVQNFETAALANAGTVTIPANTGFMIVQNSSSIATGTVVLPTPSAFSFPATAGGNELEVNFQNPVGALTVTGTVTNAPTAIAAAGTSISFIQNTPTSWLRRIMS